MNIYDFKVKDNQGQEVSLEKYKGKILVIVNTATKCGLTPQYEQLEQLYSKYKDKGVEILDFPCNQFLEQAPGTDEDIQSFCQLNYHTNFDRFSKIDVNGEHTDPLFIWLKKQAPTDKGDEQSKAFADKVKEYTKYHGDSDIKWNFGKFIIDRSGNVAGRYSPALSPEYLEADIKTLL